MVGVFNEVLGREVEIPERPERIVSFSPAATETVFLIGGGERVAGVSAFCARPPEARGKRKVGSYSTVRPEVLEEISPDLILTVTGYQRDFAVELAKRYPVYPLELPATVAGIVDFVAKVGLVVGPVESARRLVASLTRAAGSLPTVRGLKVYVELDLGGPVTLGAYSYVSDAIGLLGSSNIFGERRSEWLKPDLDEVEDEDPDVIIYEPKMFGRFTETDFQALLESRKWKGLRAVANGDCHLTPGPLDFLAHHGPSFITEALPWLGARLEEARGRRK
jgi:iron complex transport system substrate-binding protein